MANGEVTVTVLYKERVAGEDFGVAEALYNDEVSVELRKWQSGDRVDFVLSRLVKVDGDVVVTGRDVLADYDTGRNIPQSAALRLAIRTFDELRASHPNKDRMQ